MSQSTDLLLDLPSVAADLHYLVPMAERPRTYTYEPPAGTPRSNAAHAPHRMTIRSLRPIADGLSLDREGFVLLESPGPRVGFTDETAIREVYGASRPRRSAGQPVPGGCSASITRSAVAFRGPMTGRWRRRASRCRACMWITRPAPARSACVTCLPRMRIPGHVGRGFRSEVGQ